MRLIAILGLAACGASAPAPTAPTPHASAIARGKTEPDRMPIDPIVALTPTDDGQASWVIPGTMQLELGGTTLEAAGAGTPVEVAVIDQQGNLVRVAVRLDHVRFSFWTDRTRLLSVLKHDQRITNGAPTFDNDTEVVLRSGAHVRRLAHKERSTQIRYLGALQVEGWVPDDVLGDRAPARDPIGRIPTGRKTLMVIPGAVIRAEPRWAGNELAVMANGYFLDTIRELDDAWSEVAYEDGDVVVHGFVSKHDPPGRVHRWRETESALASSLTTPNATIASGTCLYSRIDGDAIGYIVDNRPVDLDDAGKGWWTVTLDAPWGPIAFAAQGPTKNDLVACAPPNTVPPAVPPPAPPPP